MYRDIGCKLLRVWGGAFLEKESFYSLCDELGLLVWQELPRSSSGVENWPPEDEGSIRALEGIASSYIARRHHHVSLALWGGGNELMGNLDGEKTGIGKPIDRNHPIMKRLDALFRREDSQRHFMPASSSGPRFAAEEDFGKGIHSDVHGQYGHRRLLWPPKTGRTGPQGDLHARHFDDLGALNEGPLAACARGLARIPRRFTDPNASPFFSLSLNSFCRM